jgi:hypothetical protein
MRRALAGLGIAAVASTVLLAAPATASADVIFDQADADELVATLAEAYQAQGVCYGWQVDVDNVGIPESSSGSNFGAGTPLRDASEFDSCETTVEFQANIRWTSESSESEDSASYQVQSLPEGPTTSDLDSLELISEDGLVGDNVDVDVYKAVAALPLLAADAGVAEPLEASPAPETEAQAAGGAPTNSPGSDFMRQTGNTLLFAALLILAGGVFAWWTLRSASARRRAASAPVEPGGAPQYLPPEWSDQPSSPPDTRQDRPDQDRPGSRPPHREPGQQAGQQSGRQTPPTTPPSGQPGTPADPTNPQPRPEE